MEINWLGYSCFRLKGKRSTVITDPFTPELGYRTGKLSADIVTISHPHPNHSFTGAIEGTPRIISGPGEYEIAGVLVLGFPMYHDTEHGAKLGKNTVYFFEIEDVTICHLGDLGHALTAQQLEDISGVNVLLVPVGGGNTINASTAAQVVRHVEPKVVIPMHYKTPNLKVECDAVDKFLQEMGVTQAVRQPKFTVTRSSMPDALQVVVMDDPQ